MTSRARYLSSGLCASKRSDRVGTRRAVNSLAAAGLMALSIGVVGLATTQVAEAQSPTISSVTLGGTQSSPTITITGSGFGTESDLGTANDASNTQNCSPATGYDYGTNFYIQDQTTDWVVGLGPPNLAAVGAIITTYTDSEVVFTPGSCYGQNGWTFAPGDDFTMYVLGTQFSGTVSFPTETTETDWSAPESVDSNTLDSVSCASSSFCAMVDDEGDEVTYNGSTFSSPLTIDSGEEGEYEQSVSCSSTTFCAAVNYEGEETTFDGSSWSEPTTIDDTSLLAVSCSSSDFCVAVDDNGDALTYDGSDWASESVTEEIPLVSVSCPNSSFCVATDSSGDVYMYEGSGVGGGWTSADNIDGSNFLNSVSCPGENFCVAVDDNGNAFTYDGSEWSSADEIDGGTEINSVSCSTTTFCMATDTEGNALNYNGSSWSSESIDGTTGIESVSCWTTSLCVAGDDSGNALIYGWVSANYTCSVTDYGTTTDPVVLSESPSPPASITAPGTYETTLSVQATIPASYINAAIEDGVTSITIGSQAVTMNGLTDGSPSSSVSPNALTASATNLPISFTPQMNTPFTYSTTYNPETWQTVSNPGTVDFTPGDIDAGLTLVRSGSPMQITADCTPPNGVSPLDSTDVNASSSTPTFQVQQPSVPPLNSEVTSPSDAGWAVELTNTSTVAVDGLSAQVAIQGEGSTINFDFAGMADTGTACTSAGTNEATCNVSTLAAGDSLTLNVLVETTQLPQGLSISGSVDVTSTNAPTVSSTLGSVSVVVVTNGTVAVAVPNVVLKSTTGQLSNSVPAKVRLTLPATVPATGPFESAMATGESPFAKVKGPPVSVTLEPLAGSQDPELCPSSSGGCEGDIVEIDGDFSAYTSAKDPISVVVRIFYGSTPPAGKIYFQDASNDTPVKLPACVKSGGKYNTPCVDGKEKITGGSGQESTWDVIFFTGGDPLVGRR
jgi:hypothetical protein